MDYFITRIIKMKHGNTKPKLLDQVMQKIRVIHYRKKIGKSDTYWIKKYILFIISNTLATFESTGTP